MHLSQVEPGYKHCWLCFSEHWVAGTYCRTTCNIFWYVWVAVTGRNKLPCLDTQFSLYSCCVFTEYFQFRIYKLIVGRTALWIISSFSPTSPHWMLSWILVTRPGGRPGGPCRCCCQPMRAHWGMTSAFGAGQSVHSQCVVHSLHQTTALCGYALVTAQSGRSQQVKVNVTANRWTGLGLVAVKLWMKNSHLFCY